MTSQNNESCLQHKISFSTRKGTMYSTAWRCKNVASCDYCRKIEAGELRKAINSERATMYLVPKDKWNAYHQKMKRAKSKMGYIKIPQENGVLAVYSTVEPNCDYRIADRLSDEQLLANRLLKTVKGNTTRTGLFARNRDSDQGAQDSEKVEIVTYFPLFRYKESGKIMPYQEYFWSVLVTAYRKSPFTIITKDNAEDHLRYVSNYIISIMMLEPLYAGKIEPLVKVGTKNIPVVNFDNWVDGADVKMSGIKNSFDNPTMQLMDDLLMNGEPPFDWVGYCLCNGLVYDSDISKSYYESERALEEGDKQILEMIEKFGTTN